MAAAQYFQQVQKIYIAFYQRPADPAGLQYWASRMDAAGGDVAQVIDAFASSAEALELYGPVNATTIGAVIDSLYMALFNVAPDAAGKQFYVDGFAAGTFTAGTIALAVLNGAQNNDLIAINNKVQVANEFTKQVDGRDFTDPYFGTGNSFNATYSGDADAVAARDILKAVNSQPSTILSSAAVTSALKSQIADVNDPILAVATGQTKLTVGADNIDGVAGNTTYTAPIVQNQNGAVTNTLESGDVISAVGTGNKLVADLTLTTSGGIPAGSAISASTNNIQVVELRSQTPLLDIGGPHPNFSHIDAQNFNGVQQWWTVNSRSDLQIEDVRSRPEETTIGMRDTDPEVGFYVYFDPQQLSNLVRTEDSALNIKLADNDNLTSLANVPVNGLIFKLDGVQFTLKSDAIGNAVTYADLLAALQAEIAKEAGLAGVTATLNPDNTITIQDTAGKSFTPVGWSFINDQVPANGNIIYNQTVGNPALVDQPITTNVLLDNVGRTSPGGVLDIGSLGDGGVEQFDVVVDRSSWVEAMESTSHLGNFVPGIQLDHLEIVNFASTGAKGNVTVGERDTNRVDGRVENGLTDVRVVNGKGFEGKMNLGIVITGDSIDRYLDGATDPVNFTYDGSAQSDIFNIDVASAVSNDPDFRMEVNMGASNDRLILSGADNLNNISVDGGTGNNTFVTSTSIGVGANPLDIANHEFESFQNFQNLEIEGAGAAVDFTTLGGVTSVVVATDSGANTALIDLADGNGIVVSGKNQTIGNNSNADQNFGDIDVVGADGAALTVTLQNTARIDGELSVDLLNIYDESVTNQSAVRTLNIVSAGARQTTNTIDSIDAERVNTFNLTGTQALTATLDAAANTTGAPINVTNLTVNGSALTGALDFTVNSAIVTTVDGTNHSAVFTGTAGTKDVLTFDGDAIVTTGRTTVTGFETVRFDNIGVSDFDASGVSGVTAYEFFQSGHTNNGLFSLNNLRSTETIRINVDEQGFGHGIADDIAFEFAAGVATAGSKLNLEFFDSATTAGNPNDLDFSSQGIAVRNYQTVSVDLGGTAGNADVYAFDFGFQDRDGLVVGDALFDFATVAAKTFVLTGGQASATNLGDSVDLGALSSTLTLVDLAGYKGGVTATLDNPFIAGDSVSKPLAISGNTEVRVNGFELDFTDADHVDATITTFKFTTDAVNATQDWTIANFQDFNTGTLQNLSILDLSSLNVNGLVDIIITQVGADTHITSNEGLNFEIVLTGVGTGDLFNENFKFAA